MAVKEPTGGLKKACWKGYTAVGMKMKNGRKVPNCVPANEEKENYGLPAHSMKHIMQKIKDGHWEVSSGEVKSGQHLSIIDHTKGKKKRMIHVKEESNEPKDREWGTTKLTKRYKKDTPGQCDCNTMKEESDQITEDAKRDRVSADLHKQGIGSHWRNPQVLVVHDKHKKKVQQHMDKITGGWVHVVGHSEEPMNEEAEKQTHLIKVTVSEPSLKSAEPMLKGVRVRATSEGEAIKRAKSHFRKAGYKVHDAYHHSTITTVKKAGQMDEAATSDNPHYGYHGTQEKDADKKYSAMHTRVKKVVGAAGHLGDVKKPNVVVRHYLDSVRGRHADGRSDGYIARDFAKFKKTYKPEMHEEAGQMDERNDVWHPDPKVDSKMGGRAAAITQGKPTKKQMDLALLKRLAAAGKRIAAEEVEQIDELKRDTLISYVGKAYADKKRRKGKNAVAAMTDTLDDYLKGAKKSDNRSTGITRAYASLNKEEVMSPQGDEPTPSHYNIVHRDSKRVVGTATTIKRARSARDRHDNKYGSYAHSIVPVFKEEVEQMDEMKSSNPKGLAYKITAASHAANPSYGPHDPSVDPKTNFGAGATRSSAVAGLRAARAIKRAGGNPHDPEHIETISKAIHGSPADYGGKSRGWSHHALTSTNQSPEQKERRSKLTGTYGGLSDDEKEKDRQIARVIAKRVHPVKESVGRDATKELIARIKKAGGNAKRNKAGLLVPTGKPKAKLEEGRSRFGTSPRKYAEHELDSKIEKRGYDFSGVEKTTSTVHVNGKALKTHTGSNSSYDAKQHVLAIAAKAEREGRKIPDMHIKTSSSPGWVTKYEHSDRGPNQRFTTTRETTNEETIRRKSPPKDPVSKIITRMNPDRGAIKVNETRNIIREVIKKAVDKQETNKSNGKTATGEPMPKVQIDPSIDLSSNGGPRGI